MPVWNEGSFIETSLGAVLAQTYPADRLQVIVADGMSTDGTRDKIRRLQSSHANLHLVDNPERIVSTGLNRAFPHATGEVIIRIDGHCSIHPEYVARCVRHLQSSEIDGVGGPIHTVGQGRVSSAIAAAMSSRFGVGGSLFRTGSAKSVLTDTVPFPAYTRKVMEEAGPYDEELVQNQDDEYNYRIREMGGSLLLASDVTSVYFSRASFASLWRQYFGYGYWKVRVLQMHPRQMMPRQFVPALFLMALLACAVIAPFVRPGAWPLVSLCSIYALAILSASLFVSRGKGQASFPWVFVSFAVLHFSYGLGSLSGLIAFWHGWFVQAPGVGAKVSANKASIYSEEGQA